ncbi:ATP-binding protein [Pectinatus frisingensis]|uniref:ATP-binding protein n=1 Tax=Pectinatus frisingensis TaxID=865 RepID=UPI0018C7CECD|nr:ATP-binding protein [Pectinatus frisingensis]
MESIAEVMKFKNIKDKDGNITAINPYLETYNRLKMAGKIKKSTSTMQYKCPECHDTGYITTISGGEYYQVPCKCLEKIRVESRLKKSGISPGEYAKYSFLTFRTDTTEHADMKRLAVNYLQTRNIGQGIGYFGASGTGKTHICIAICQAMTCDFGEEHYYFSYRSEIQRIKAVMYSNAELYSQAIQHWISVNNLYIDDLFKFAMKDGKIQQQDLQIMFDIINTRYINHKATLFSSEYALSYITNNIDEALGSRIFAMVDPYKMGCEDINGRFKKGA